MKMAKIKPYSLKFVNRGKPFDMPNWTPEKHESALAKLNKDTKKLNDEEQNKEFKYYVIHETLLELDEDCSMDNIRRMHPMDLIELFNAVYNAGREGIYNVDFLRGKNKTPANKKQKSTGTKN